MSKKKKNNRYIALDFEKMDTIPVSVCSVGLAVYENGELIDTFYSYICPPTKNENWYCCNTHGIHYDDVKDSPTFPEVWEKIDKIIGDSPVICHNFGTERSCIKACNEYYGTDYQYNFICTLAMSRDYLSFLPSKGLDFVCNSLNYYMGTHHNALDDAKACGEVFFRIKKKFNLNENDERRYTRSFE
jgi:DNA polymerase-3 subunit epsilon